MLIVEDVAPLAASLVRGFGEEGFDASAVASGTAALARIERHDVDALLLDLGLPDVDGLEILPRVRELSAALPILVLTARDALEGYRLIESSARAGDDGAAAVGAEAD